MACGSKHYEHGSMECAKTTLCCSVSSQHCRAGCFALPGRKLQYTQPTTQQQAMISLRQHAGEQGEVRASHLQHVTQPKEHNTSKRAGNQEGHTVKSWSVTADSVLLQQAQGTAASSTDHQLATQSPQTCVTRFVGRLQASFTYRYCYP